MSKSSSLAAQTQLFINQNPSIKDCLRRGLINYSALAREVCRGLKLPPSQAAVMATVRYSHRIRSQRSQEAQFAKTLKSSKLFIRGRMLIAGVYRESNSRRIASLQEHVRKNGDELTLIEGHTMVSLTTSMAHLGAVRTIFRGRIHTLAENVAQLVMATSPKAMFTPGLSAFTLARITAAGVNLIEEYTCAGEHLFIVAEADLPKTLTALEIRES